MIVNLAASATNVVLQILVLVVIVAERNRGASAALIGIVLAGYGVGGVTGSIAGGWLSRRVQPNLIVMVTPWIWAAAIAPVGLISAPVLLMVVLGLTAFLAAVWNIASGTIFNKVVPDRLIGRVSSVGALTAYGALPLGALAAGLLVQAYGPASAGLIAGATMVGLAALVTAAPSVRRGPGILEPDAN